MKDKTKTNSHSTGRSHVIWAFALIAAVVASIAITRYVDDRTFVSDGEPASSVAAETTKVEQATTFLETVGFGDPTYLGITQAAEGEYPTFRATAIGGAKIDLWIRTTPNGGLELQPVGVWETIASADDLTILAWQAVDDWENMPEDIKPSADGGYGEYESREYMYNLLERYLAPESYAGEWVNETAGWPEE